jgi:hypothetical protein
MTRLRRTPIAALIALAAAIPLAGCGRKSETTFAPTEGIYINVGPLIYQVQISRQLNPSDVEDARYLEGLSPAERKLAPDQTWFAVFIRVQNERGSAHPSAANFEIADTVGNVYRPIPLPSSNPFVYRPGIVPPHSGVLPTPDSTAASGPIQGSMLLFKVTTASLSNRPLELTIHSPTAAKPAVGRVELDV